MKLAESKVGDLAPTNMVYQQMRKTLKHTFIGQFLWSHDNTKIKINRYLNGNCVCTQQECLIRLRAILLQCLTFQEYKVQNSSQERNWDMTTYIGYVMLTYIFVSEKQKFEVYNENSVCFTKSSTNRHFLICVLLCFCWALGTWVKEKSHLPKTEYI